jgi:hypothetical protein
VAGDPRSVGLMTQSPFDEMVKAPGFGQRGDIVWQLREARAELAAYLDDAEGLIIKAIQG